MATAISNGTRIADLSPGEVAAGLQADEIMLVDVREDFERTAEWIPGARHNPLARLDPGRLAALAGGRRIVLHCRGGNRSSQACRQWLASGYDRPIAQLAGGLEAWKAAGLGTERGAGPAIPVMRQVQIAAGTLVLVGVILGTTVSGWFLALSGFVGAGLVFAGLSGWCGMARLLAVVPWNRPAATCGRQTER